ncbi:hypothetical protein K474DRAFT_1577863, partial [Panus rudis PR-1116 ss-1]
LTTETGIAPIQYRRATLALRYLLHLLSPNAPLLPRATLAEACSLARRGQGSWVTHLQMVLATLYPPVPFDPCAYLSQPLVQRLIQATNDSMHQHALLQLQSLKRLRILYLRISNEAPDSPPSHKAIVSYRDYLDIGNADHRKALTRLLCSDHLFAVEQHRRSPYKPRREWRICRFCRFRDCVEDEAHVLLDCVGSAALTEWRIRFF